MRSPSKTKSLARLEGLATFLDSSIPLGKTGYRIGMDPLIGLIPGIGDPLSALIGGYIIVEAARLGTSRLTLTKMMFNLGFDTLLGAVPFVGDLFDFAFKANQRNILLVQEARLVDDHHPQKRLSSAFFLTLTIVLIFIALISATALYSALKILDWLIS